MFVLMNHGNYNSSTPSSNPVNTTVYAGGVTYVSSGTETKTLVVVATDDGQGDWTYSEIYSDNKVLTITGSDGSTTTENDLVSYLFVASGTSTTSSFKFSLDETDDLNGPYTQTWSDTNSDGTKSSGAINWTWESHLFDHVLIDSTWDTTSNTATVKSEWNSDANDAYTGTGSYTYEIAGGSVAGNIAATNSSFDTTSGSGTEIRTSTGTWAWASGTSQHDAGSSSDYQSSGTGAYATNDQGVIANGSIAESAETFDNETDSESGQVGTDGQWTWYTGKASFNGGDTSNFASSGTGTYTDTTENSKSQGTFAEESGFSTNSAYSGKGTLAADTWSWTQGGATFTSNSYSDFVSTGAGTYWYSEAGATVSGVTATHAHDHSGNSVSVTSNLLTDGTWSAGTGIAKSSGNTSTDSSYSGAGTYSHVVDSPTGTQVNTGTVTGTIVESGGGTDVVQYSAQQALASDGTWIWTSGQATSQATLDAHTASSGAGTYSYTTSDGTATVSGDVKESSHDDSQIQVSQQAALSTAGDWSVTEGLLSVSASAGDSTTYSGGGDYTRTYGDGTVKGHLNESGGNSVESTQVADAAINSKGDWQWTNGTSHISGDTSSNYSFDGSGGFAIAAIGNFAGKAMEHGYQNVGASEEVDESLSTDGTWNATSGTSTYTADEDFWSNYSGTGSITSNTKDGSMTIGFTMSNDRYDIQKTKVVQEVQTDGTWGVTFSDQKVASYDQTSTAFSGGGNLSMGSNAFSLEIGISIAGDSYNMQLDTEESQIATDGTWQLTDGKKQSVNNSSLTIGFSGAGQFPLASGGDTGQFLISGSESHVSNFQDTHELGTKGDWWLTSGAKSDSDTVGYAMALNGTISTEFDVVPNQSLDLTMNFQGYDYFNSSVVTSSKVDGVGRADQKWGQYSGHQSESDGEGFLVTASGKGTMVVPIMDGQVNADMLVSMRDSTDHKHAESYNLAADGNWVLDSGTITDSTGDYFNVSLAGLGTYSRQVSGGSVSGVSHLLNLTAEEEHNRSSVQTLASTGWTYDSGSKTDHSLNKFEFAYAGIGGYAYSVQGGQVIGTISENGVIDQNDTSDANYGMDTNGNWVFDKGSTVNQLTMTSDYKSSGTGGYGYSVIGGAVHGVISEKSWSNSSDVEMETTTAAAIGGSISIGTKTISSNSGNTSDYSGSGNYAYNIPDPSGATKSAGTMSGRIDEDGNNNDSNVDNEQWTMEPSGQWAVVSGSRASSTDSESNSQTSGSGDYYYWDVIEKPGQRSVLIHSGHSDEESSSHLENSNSDGWTLTSTGWVQAAGEISHNSILHDAMTSSGSGSYTFNTFDTTNTTQESKLIAGTLEETDSRLNDSTDSETSTFAPNSTAYSWRVASGAKTNYTKSGHSLNLTGDGTYQRKIDVGTLYGKVSTHTDEESYDSTYSDVWAADPAGAWTMQSGSKKISSDTESNVEWSGSGKYTRELTINGEEWSSSGTVTDLDSHIKTGELDSQSWSYSKGAWSETSGRKTHTDDMLEETIYGGSGTYSRTLTNGLTGEVSGTFEEAGGWSDKHVDTNSSDYSWVFGNWGLTSGQKAEVHSSGYLKSYSGSGDFVSGIVRGKFSLDKGSEGTGTLTSKIQNYEGGAWTLDWHGYDDASNSNSYAYSGEGSSLDGDSSGNPLYAGESSTWWRQQDDTENISYSDSTKLKMEWTSSVTGDKSWVRHAEETKSLSSVKTTNVEMHSEYLSWSMYPSSNAAGELVSLKQSVARTTDGNYYLKAVETYDGSGSEDFTWDANTHSSSGSGTHTVSSAIDTVQMSGGTETYVETGRTPNQATDWSLATITTHDQYRTVTTISGITSNGSPSGSSISNHVEGNGLKIWAGLQSKTVDGNTTYTPRGGIEPFPAYSENPPYGGYYTASFKGNDFTWPKSGLPGSPSDAPDDKQNPDWDGDGKLDARELLYMRWQQLPSVQSVVERQTQALRRGDLSAFTNLVPGLSSLNSARANASAVAKIAREQGIQGLYVHGGTAFLDAIGVGQMYNGYEGKLPDGTQLHTSARVMEGVLGGVDLALTVIPVAKGAKAGIQVALQARTMLAGMGKTTWKQFASTMSKAYCQVALRGDGCFDGNTMVIVGPRAPLTLAVASDSETIRWEWVAGALGLVLVSRLANRLSGEKKDDEELVDVRRRVGVPDVEAVTAGPGIIVPQWLLATCGIDFNSDVLPQSSPLAVVNQDLLYREFSAANCVPTSSDDVFAADKNLTMIESLPESRIAITTPQRPREVSLAIQPTLKRRPQGLRRHWLSALGLVSLLMAVACAWQGLPKSPAVASSAAPVAQPFETRRIADIKVMDWVLAGNPQEKPDLEFADEIDPSQWRVLTLSAPKKSGGTAEVVMARPLAWLYEQSLNPTLAVPAVDADLLQELFGVEELPQDEPNLPAAIDATQMATFDPQSLVGKTIYVSVPECGIDGHATVLGIMDCPQLNPRPGPEYQLVTATFHHRNATLLDLKIEGESATIGTTPNHPFWSEDRQDFVRAEELKLGERLRGHDGTFPKVVSSSIRGGTHDVYNLEVHLDHTYHVATNGILVHNGTPCDIVINLGLRNSLSSMHRKTGGWSYRAWLRNGITSSNPRITSQFESAFKEATSRAKVINFSLDGLDLKKAFIKGRLGPTGAPKNFTNWEFTQVLNDPKTVFWQNGRQVSLERVLARLGDSGK